MMLPGEWCFGKELKKAAVGTEDGKRCGNLEPILIVLMPGSPLRLMKGPVEVKVVDVKMRL